MIVQLARKPTAIAWTFFILIYAEILLTPVIARANNAPYPMLQGAASKFRPTPLGPLQKNSISIKPVESNFLKPVEAFACKAEKSAATHSTSSPEIGGPGQPEMQAFSSVNDGKMVDLFSGNFNYSIPLLDVGGYPLALGYTAGISMDQEASWVGLGWNVNPGTISRNLRGLPDDFNGDIITKTVNMKPNKTVGVTAGTDVEIAGLPKNAKPGQTLKDSGVIPDFSAGLHVGASLGVTHNNYRGWGIERGLNGGINVGRFGQGTLTAGLSLTSSSMDGLSVTPSIAVHFKKEDAENGPAGLSLSLPFNSRTGLQSLQMGVWATYKMKLSKYLSMPLQGNFQNSLISFYQPAVTPSISVPYTNHQFTFTGKAGWLEKIIHPSLYVSGYVATQYIAPADVTREIPAYGYLNMQDGAANTGALLDYNREKELPYREKPVYPHIAVPSYTYDAFSISGEGTGGMFRAYRSEIGFVHDHLMKTRSASSKGGIDIGVKDIVHIGADIGYTSSQTTTGPWSGMNPVADVIAFRKKDKLHEASYFRNPGEKSINSKPYYDALGGDDVVAVHLKQYEENSSNTQAMPVLDRFRNGNYAGDIPLSTASAAKPQRDKRTQVISHLTAAEAAVAGLSKYIENFQSNVFDPSICVQPTAPDEGTGTGLNAELFDNQYLQGTPIFKTDNEGLYHEETRNSPYNSYKGDFFSIRFSGRLRAPVTGTYKFSILGNDGVRLKLNGITIVEDWRKRDFQAGPAEGTANLVAGEFYDIIFEMYDNKFEFGYNVRWGVPIAPYSNVTSAPVLIPNNVLYCKTVDTFEIKTNTAPSQILLTKENRVRGFRKAHHLSEITVLNTDGRRYVYGIPVYNLLQKDVNFTANGKDQGNMDAGLVKFGGTDNTPDNKQGRDGYFSKEEIPAYAHSFLLTGILSDDYSDLTGDGISEDDPGTAIKFNYSRLSSVFNPFKWRAPFSGKDSASFNEGLRTDYRDDKATYSYGEKELWYMHSIESKTMIATFFTSSRDDMPSVDEKGYKDFTAPSRKLDSIFLFNKADFAKWGVRAIPVKAVYFEYSYELCKNIKTAGSGKLTLKSVWFNYNGIRQPKAKSNPYIFNYNSNNPSYNSQHSDRWGTYKSPLQNPGSTAQKPIRNSEYPYALQDSAVAAFNAGAWNLNNISLPSGGSMQIDYESDDYGFVQNKTAAQLFKLAGLGSSSDYSKAKPSLYGPKLAGKIDYLYVFVKVPYQVNNANDVYNLYLQDLEKLYFKIFVRVPKDQYSNGQTHEYVPCYARIEKGNYGVSAKDVIWFKLEAIDANGKVGGDYSPLAKAATQFLRLNLPSKAYPGSETGNDLDLGEAVQMLASLGNNIWEAIRGFDKIARDNNWMNDLDLNKSFVRLNNPQRKKYGGGHRVKRITIFDNWDKMTNQRAAKYGQEYTYTTEELVNGNKTIISSGVAEYEPAIGGEENPFHLPIEYIDQPSVLVPVTTGYSEEPLGEAHFPAPGVGYSKVRVRTINYLKKKSANGFEETQFFTARDYPVYTDRSLIDNFTKKRYRPSISNFFRINSYHFLSISQGFKVELNDMHGKLRAKASYAETDPNNYLSYQEYFYRTESGIRGKRLLNTVMAIHPDGKIDTTALIGKDVELMVDMREQESLTISTNIAANVDIFGVGSVPPFIIGLPSPINMYQREKNLYRSVAAMKVIRRYGILDSVIAIDKGSRISTKDLLYDSETGDVLLTRTQNEFDDYVYNLSYPSHWAYPTMGGAYRNIDVFLQGQDIRGGKLKDTSPEIDTLFSSGDEILVGGKESTGGTACNEAVALAPTFTKVWCIDSSVINGGQRSIYFIDRNGRPFSGFDVSMRIVRSGHRNIFASVGAVTSMNELIKKDAGGNYQLIVDENSGVFAAQAGEFGQFRKVEDMKRVRKDTGTYYTCPPGYVYNAATGDCIKDTILNVTKRFKVCPLPINANYYSSQGTFIYSEDRQFRTLIDTANAFWIRSAKQRPAGVPYTPVTFPAGTEFIPQSAMTLRLDSASSMSAAKGTGSIPTDRKGPFPRTGIWACTNGYVGSSDWFGFSTPVYIPQTGWYHIGFASDNVIKIQIDNQLFFEFTNIAQIANFGYWHILPKYLSKGVHVFTMEGKDDKSEATGFGLEIYNNTTQQLHNATSYSNLNLLFSTKDLIFDSIPSTFSCPIGYSLDRNDTGLFVCRSYVQATAVPVYTSSCKSIVTDTIFNPYVVGALGTWKSKKAYTFYSNRAEEDPAIETNIRENGTFKDFIPYWSFSQSKLKAGTDTVKWVWNSESTLFSKKGLELENKDPLGRFNSGIYGYDQTLPIAVIQNSRYREAGFEGFEDYHSATTNCTQECTPARHFDFSSYAGQMDTTEKHTGNRSLKLMPGQQAGITADLSLISKDTITPRIIFSNASANCVSAPALEKLTTNKNILLPNFSPTPGKKMLVSVWVKELQDCKCTSYQNNKVAVIVKGPGTENAVVMQPSGSIIEGWQRYEIPVDVAGNATSITVAMQATGNATVFFDDLRIHPYNANMKSFVFHPVNLRLMAELDENNYATFYEYDDEGTLIRVKKETQRGIKTIKETRSSQAK